MSDDDLIRELYGSVYADGDLPSLAIERIKTLGAEVRAARDKARAFGALVIGIPMPTCFGTHWNWACAPDTPRLTVAQARRLAEWYGEHYAERFATPEAALLAAAEAARLEEQIL